MSYARLIVATAALAFTAQSAQAQIFGQPRSGAQRAQDRQIAQIPRCERPLGTLTIADGEPGVYDAMELQPPQTLLRVVVQRSGCFTLVDRGSAAMDVVERERRLASAGSLRRDSNMGGGQMRAADFILLAEVASENDNASGAGARANARSNDREPERRSRGGGLLSGALGLGASVATGGLIPPTIGMRGGGGMDSRTQEANTVLSIVNVRTTETLAVSQGYAAKRDINWNISASNAFGGFVGGGYENTEIGRIVGQSFINAYADLVAQVGRMDLDLSAADQAPVAETAMVEQNRPSRSSAASEAPASNGLRVTQSTTLREEPGGAVLRVMRGGQTVHATGEEDGDWVEVIDESDDIGWIQQDRLAPAR